ncbi:TetR/AcrR family transcriptional regulator [Acidaminobacterium chupaoyuni]
MNHAATSEEALLRASLKFASEEGLKSLNIRSIAKECGVSVGCVYRYFPSKAALISATVGKIWESIFQLTKGSRQPSGFCESVRWVFSCIRNGCAEYPSFFRQHTAAFGQAEKSDGRRAMNHYFDHIRQTLLGALEADPAFPPQLFDETFTRERFVGFVFDHLLSLGLRGAADCEFLICVIQKLAR